MSDRTLPIVVGGGALAAYLWTRSRRRDLPDVPPDGVPDVPTTTAEPSPAPPSTAPPFNRPLPGRWVWPVPIWNGRRPEISDGFGSPRPGGAQHQGVDLMFARTSADAALRASSPNGSTHFVMPENMPALAAADGVIWLASWTPRGWTVVVDHTPLAPVATYYTHLSMLFVAPTTRAASEQRVRAGDALGIVGADPMDGAHLKHLHFELWRGGPRDAVDPSSLMRTWERVPDPRTSKREPIIVATRNAALSYRPVGARGDPYPEWVRDLRGKSGVYIIRERDDDGEPTTVYVGESHTNRLRETLTRHFAEWRRWKGFWKNQFAEGHDPGLTYDRERVEVAVKVTTPNRALDEEARLIRRLRPRDNLIGQPDEAEPVPF